MMTRPGGRWLRSPVVQFLAVGLVALVAIVVATSVLGRRAAQDEALTDARSTTELLARSVAEPALPRGLVTGDVGAIDRFDRVATDRLVVGDPRRVKIWSGDGTIVYSDDVRLIGERFALDDEELDILRDGGSDAELSDLSEPENRYERGGDELVEVYTRIVSPEGRPLLFEAYYSADRIAERRAEVVAPFRRITLGALAVLVVVATALLWVLTRRASTAAAERERLLRSAATASDAERRRIARDLHDGVVQDLAGSAFAISALARDADEPARSQLTETSASLRGNLRALRSLLVEIHPPDLTAASLPSALEDLTAPAAALGVATTVTVSRLEGASDDSVALVWRAAQELVRNTLRHAGARTLEVDVEGAVADDRIVLTVTDDGAGYDPHEVADRAHYGLRGLESLVDDAGGTLEVRSGPTGGTTTRVRVPR